MFRSLLQSLKGMVAPKAGADPPATPCDVTFRVPAMN
jgi:hypothetical protein